MTVIANGQSYKNSTWLSGNNGIWIDGGVGKTPILGKSIPSTIIERVSEKLKEQEEKHPDYVNVDEAYDEICKEAWEGNE